MSRIAVIDFETTGTSPNLGDRATEVAIVMTEGGRVVDRFVAYHLGLSAETDDIEPPCGESHGDETYALQSAANDT